MKILLLFLVLLVNGCSCGINIRTKPSKVQCDMLYLKQLRCVEVMEMDMRSDRTAFLTEVCKHAGLVYPCEYKFSYITDYQDFKCPEPIECR